MLKKLGNLMWGNKLGVTYTNVEKGCLLLFLGMALGLIARMIITGFITPNQNDFVLSAAATITTMLGSLVIMVKAMERKLKQVIK